MNDASNITNNITNNSNDTMDEMDTPETMTDTEVIQETNAEVLTKPDTTTDASGETPNRPRSKSGKKDKVEKMEKPVKTMKQVQSDIQDVRILKEASCLSLSGRSTLTYHVGCVGEAIQLRVFRNTGKGYFNREWIPFDTIKTVLTRTEQMTADSLRPIFLGKSVNSAGFLMAVLKSLGVIETSKKNQRCYSHRDSASFEEDTATLMQSSVSLVIPEAPAPAASKKGMLKAKKG